MIEWEPSITKAAIETSMPHVANILNTNLDWITIKLTDIVPYIPSLDVYEVCYKAKSS
jgi:hypothetical protein